MSQDTPPQQMRTPTPGESVLEYRVGRLEETSVRTERKIDRILEKMSEKEAEHKVAIERCSGHGDAIKAIETERLPEVHRRIDAIQGSSGMNRASDAKPDAQAVDVRPGWGKMDWASFFTGISGLIAALWALLQGNSK